MADASSRMATDAASDVAFAPLGGNLFPQILGVDPATGKPIIDSEEETLMAQHLRTLTTRSIFASQSLAATSTLCLLDFKSGSF